MLRTLNVARRGRQALNLRLIPLARGWERCGPFDVVHAHFAPNGVSAVDLRAAGCFTAPVVTSFHGYDINVLPGTRGGAGYARLFAEGDAFTANSNFLAARAAALGCLRDRMHIMPMGVDRPPTAMPPRPNDGVTRVLTVARLTEEKGLRDGIAAVGSLARAGAPVCYRIIGDGPLEGELRAMIAEEGLAQVVSLTGSASEAEVHEAFRDSDLFLLPSVRAADGSEEGQGLVLQEAQAMGLPVITRHSGAFRRALTTARAGSSCLPATCLRWRRSWTKLAAIRSCATAWAATDAGWSSEGLTSSRSTTAWSTSTARRSDERPDAAVRLPRKRGERSRPA